MATLQSRTDESELPCYCDLFSLYIGLGLDGNFEKRDREFKSKKSAAGIFGKNPKTLDRMVAEWRLAFIRVGGSVLIHIPTSAALLKRRQNWTPCPKCPDFS
jgi:hypothetical protein